MTEKPTLQQRERELQTLLATPAGRQELQVLETQYASASGRVRAGKSSLITYILVHEREHGVISG